MALPIANYDVSMVYRQFGVVKNADNALLSLKELTDVFQGRILE